MERPQEKNKGRRRRSPDECRRIVSDYLASGESLWRFSQGTEISYGSLRNWVKRYGEAAKKDLMGSQAFVELPSSPVEPTGIVASVRLPSGAEITLHRSCDVPFLKTLIKSLR